MAESAANAPGPGRETQHVLRRYEKHAPKYDREVSFFEKILFRGGREWVCSQARGDVLEIAIGTGRNLPFYPEGIKLIGIELSPAMLEIARGRAEALRGKVDLRLGDAQALEFPGEQFDTVVCTLALCSIPDGAKAVAEARRVLRPGGMFLALEHVRSPSFVVRAVQRLLEPLMVRFQADHLVREPLDYARAEGFEVVKLERSKWGIVERLAVRKPG